MLSEKSQNDRFCVIPLGGGTQTSQVPRDRKGSGGGQEVGEGGQSFNGCRVSVLQNEESAGYGLHNNVIVPNTTELYTQECLREWVLYVCLPQLKIKRGFPDSSAGKESACNAGDLGLVPGLRRLPGGGHDNPLQYSCLENPYRQRSLVGYNLWGQKELDTTERLSTAQHIWSLSLYIWISLVVQTVKNLPAMQETWV